MNDGMLFWILVFSVPIVSIIFRSLERIFRYRALERMAEHGQPIPPDLIDRADFAAYGRYRVGPYSLARGIVPICVGIAIAVFFWALGNAGQIHGLRGENWLPFIGIFPIMYGVGVLITGYFERRFPGDRPL